MRAIQYFILPFLLYFFGIATSAIAQINASATVTGSADSLNFKATIAPDARFIGNGSKIWIAYVYRDTVFFNGGPAGFERYAGGDAPAILGITHTTEVIDFRNWVIRPILGAEVYVGYGTDFMDMLSNQRFKKIATLTDYQPPVAGINALLGNVSLRYSVNGFTTVFTDTITFTSANLNSNGVLAKAGASGIPGRVIACSHQEGTSRFQGYEYVCAITSSSNLGNADIFWFNMTNGVISGRYNYCTEPFASSACVINIALGANGRVSGTVTSAQTRQLSRKSSTQTPDDAQKNAEHQLSTGHLQLTEQLQQSLQR